jgi:monofunctional glycosyltransferase
VIASEDGRFCNHWGVDWSAVKEAVDAADDLSDFRGASTIPMQTVKNLYLWSQRSYVRKSLEVPLAYLLSALWPKQVVIETYLNVAPWGPGIVGVEAASRYYFNKSADALTLKESTLLAAALPSPILRNPAKPSSRMLAKAQWIEMNMQRIVSRSACVLVDR